MDKAQQERRSVDDQDTSKQRRKRFPDERIVPVDKPQRDAGNGAQQHGDNHGANHNGWAVLEQSIAGNNGCEGVHDHVSASNCEFESMLALASALVESMACACPIRLLCRGYIFRAKPVPFVDLI